VPRLLPTMEQKVGYCTTSDSVRIAYGTVGHGPPVVLVVGWLTNVKYGADSPIYNSPFLKMVTEHHMAVQYDGRGFGMSDRGVHDFSLEAHLRDLLAVVDALKLQKFALYGISSGAAISIAFAARQPERVTRLILQEPVAYFDLAAFSAEERERQLAFWRLITTGWQNPAFR